MREQKAFHAAPVLSYKHSVFLFLFLLFFENGFGQGAIELPSRPVDLMQALRSTLERHPEIQLQKQLAEIDRSAVLSASAPFDLLWNAGIQQDRVVTALTSIQQITAEASGLEVSNLTTQKTSVNASIQRSMRNGIWLQSEVQLARTLDNVSNFTGTNQTTLAFTVELPLLQGRGRTVVDAKEISARHALDAGLLDVNQKISQLLASTAAQYWNAVAAERALKIAREAEQRGLSYERDVKMLIAADRVPSGEIHQLKANLAQHKANLLAAEKNLTMARLDLALAMGLNAREVTTLPLTTDALPDWKGRDPSVTPALLESFVSGAMKRRADLIAAGKRIQAAEALLPAAKDQFRRRVVLDLSAGYSGLLENTNIFATFGSPFRNPAGPNATAAIRYSFPQENSAARAASIEAESSYQQSLLARANTERTIASNVASAMVNLVKSVARLQEAREAIEQYQIALAGEQDKYHLGESSLIDVLTMEERLTTANGDEVSAQLDYAIAVENLRFATGTLIDPRASAHTLDRQLFITPPFDWEQP